MTTTETADQDSGAATDPDEHFDHRDELLHPAHEHAGADLFPRLTNISAAFIYRAMIRPEQPAKPEYVTVPMPIGLNQPEFMVAVSQWNMAWEAAQFRRHFFREDDLPPAMRKVADREGVNVVFLPRTRSRYHEYAPLFHLLSRAALERHGLPLLRAGQWPFIAQHHDVDKLLPVDFAKRLSKAWAGAMWRHLMPQYKSPISGFTRDDPIRLLAHQVDFWVPPVTEAIQETLQSFPLADNGIGDGPVPLEDGSVLEGAVAGDPRKGGDIWCGEDEALQMLRRTFDVADAGGRLRGILEAVRANRVEDDFSPRWTGAREDFERKLYRKRSVNKVRFVELDVASLPPVHGPETEVVGQVLCGDFMALLDERERTIVVLLVSGATKLTGIAETMGYRNHSAVSKRLDKIRRKAEQFFT